MQVLEDHTIIPNYAILNFYTNEFNIFTNIGKNHNNSNGLIKYLDPRSTVSWIVEVTNVDGPHCYTNNGYHLKTAIHPWVYTKHTM